MEDCINSASTYDTNTILYYSYCFHTRIQYPEETFIDFLNDIIELANLCDFEAKNRMIRDQIVVGLRDSNVRKELFKLGNPKLDELLEYLNGVENSQKIVTEASNNEDESYSYEDVHEDEQSKNVKLEFCDMEINEDCTMDDQDFHASSESLQEKNLDIKTDKTESKEIENSQLNEEKSSLTSYTLHSYIIKKEIDDNVDDKSDSDESSAENWDVSHIDRAFGISGDKDSFSDNSTTSNQCVPDGYQKEDESSEILNKAINIAELEKIEAKTENESNVFTIENKPVNLELEAGNSIKSKFPKRKIHKVIDVIELDDSDDEVDFKGNFNSNVAEKLVKVIDLSSEILPIKKEEKKCVDDNAPSLIIQNNNSVPNAKSELDIESKNTKELCDKTKVTAKENVTRKNSYRYFCSECNKNFSSKYVLKNHVLRHLGEAPYKCSYCLKIFSYSQNLNTHMLIHTNQKPYKCQECDKCFRQKANLDAHAIRHADKKLLECKEEIETVEENETSKKIRKKRGRKKCEQSLTCKKCNKSLSSVQALRLHQFTHFGIKPYECDYCDKKYAQSHTLRTHLLVHTGERPYSCDECTKSFRSKGILKAHMLIHKNDKLFSCSVCMKSFKRKSGYKAHMVVHTKEKL